LDVRLRKLSAILIFFSCTFALAEGTRIWEQSKFEDFSKGTAKGVAIRSTGGLELAPAYKALATTPSTYIWAIAADKAGNVYAAAGSPAKVYRITPDGQSTAIFQPQELQVQSLAIDKNGIIYAATNPDGKVYRLDPPASTQTKTAKASDQKASGELWKSSVFFDPTTKYIWDLAFDDAGNLFVATGDDGQIFKVTTKGEHTVFFKSDEAHIRVLAFDPKGNLIAGSDGSGLVYRISPTGEAFVLYSAPKKEITALAIDASGNIFAAGVGDRRASITPATPQVMPLPSTTPGSTSAGQSAVPGVTSGAASPTPSHGMPFVVPGSSMLGGSEIYRISVDGSPARIWTSRDDLVYALAFDSSGHLLVGTGNSGRVLAVTREDDFTDLMKAVASQVTGFAKGPGGGLFASTSNLGKVLLLGGTASIDGTYESDVFDARNFSRWGRAEVRSSGNIELFARSGNVDNPDRNWSQWTKVDLQKDAMLNVPPARFVQWKAVLHAGAPAPRLDSVKLNYLSKNVAPDFDEVTVQLGFRYQSLPKQSDAVSVGGIGNQPAVRFDPPPATTRDSDSIGVRWSIHDDNDDQMVYSIYYRGEGEKRWLLLKDKVSDKFYSFDASLLPDGGYTVKIVASDAPSHSPGEALTSERESARFEVDTTPPVIEALNAVLEGGQIHVTFRASDSFSPLERAEYSLDAGEWNFIEPVGQLSDSKNESYDFKLPVPVDRTSGATESVLEHVVVVRVYDRYDNMVAAKTVIKGK
jgi:WD40 repeat protein